MTNSKFIAMTIASVMAALLLLSAGATKAWAHASVTAPLPTDANRGVRISIGEQNEPAYIEGAHNLDLIIKDSLTNLPVGGAQTKNDNSQGLKVDAYFYPKGTTPSISGSDPGPFTAGAGWTDKKENQNVSAQFGKLGSYQAANQYYTKAGLTLYHIYGVINYFKDAEIPIDIWTDGQNVKKGFSGPTALTFSGSFGLHDLTAEYWPGSAGGVTADNYPDSVRGTLGTLKDDVSTTKTNTVDIFNFLRGIAEGINQLLTSGTPITIPAAK